MNEEHRQLSLEEETLWLRLRSLTLRLIGCVSSFNHPAAQQNSEKTAENGVAAKPSSLQSLLCQLENTLNQAAQFTEKHAQVRGRSEQSNQDDEFEMLTCVMCFTASVPVSGSRTISVGSVCEQRLLSVSADVSTASSTPPGAGNQRIWSVTPRLVI